MSIAYRGPLLHFLDEIPVASPHPGHAYFSDGLLVINEAGTVQQVGNAQDLLPQLSAECEIKRYSEHHLIVPGFIDTHIHYPQTDIIASHGEQLLQWLQQYTFPAETRFADETYALAVAERFVQELLRHGTTSAMVFATIHPQSVDALCSVAQQQNLRLITGKTLSDQYVPADLCESAELAQRHTQELIQRWHGKSRLQYAVTPRFAPVCSPALLRVSQQLLADNPGVYLHTHLAENKQEVAWVAELFPAVKDYLTVYEHYGLVHDKTVLAHSIFLNDDAMQRISATGAALSFCPSSNLFLGSGLFNYRAACRHQCKIGLGTDIGGGNHFSLLQTLDNAYKVLHLQEQILDPLEAFYLLTLGGARALSIDNFVGNFSPGKEADFLVLDCHATSLLKYRNAQVNSLSEQLFLLMMLGDDRAIAETYIMGKLAHEKIQTALIDGK